MLKKLLNLCLGLCCIFLFSITKGNAQNRLTFDSYKNYENVQNALKNLNQSNQSTTTLHTITTSPGGKKITILEIGNKTSNQPAIFVGANFEGITPVSTEGALYLAQMLLDSVQYTKNKTWYILPLPNPDASENYFSKIVYQKTTNNLEVNNDVDEQTDEDGFDDLNNDGFITKMRVADPEGTYIVSKADPRILVKADVSKGERGVYKLYSEGIDNDNDGKYNEDGPGGVNVGINFPHLFTHAKKESGLYAGSTPEVYAIMKFIYGRPEINMVFTLGTSDFVSAVPKGGRKGGANLESFKVPRRYAAMIGADPAKNYKMAEVVEMVKPLLPEGMEATPALIASLMGLGAAVNPLEDDLKFYTKFSEDYKKYAKEKNLSLENLPSEKAKDGSFELWAYYHLGVPSFSMNLFTVPKAKEEEKDNKSITVEELEKMDGETFIALGNEKITSFLKDNKLSERINAEKLIAKIKAEELSPKILAGMIKKMPKPEKSGELKEKDKALLAYIDKNQDRKGFINWKEIEHPTLGKVEIGGYIPFIENTPSTDKIDSLCLVQLPWLLKLSEKLPEIKILKEKVTDLGTGVYKLELFIENTGYLPYPISIGERNKQPAPVVIVIDGDGF